ncbi:ribosome biogenesis protein bop1-like [Sycon ciliatum]|uniref:ribosome biogenesis protein bop1-like n=1 Tax=Sycon ciliatum TaxID=27933 RepID=UPI0020ACA549|eukprot:scpid38458/ scgid31799/ Ribosome biogenesis protein bop1; Block of proliferation 1 protein
MASDSDDSVYSGLEDEPDTESELESSSDEEETTLSDLAEESDASDEEDMRNTVGNVPLEWYKDQKHVGYTLDGKKILKSASNMDEIDAFLDRMDNPDFGRTVTDPQTGQSRVLTDDEVAMIERMTQGLYPHEDFDPHAPYVDFFTNEVEPHPLQDMPDPKRRFVPSKWEHKRVMKMVRAIRNGWIKPPSEKEAEKTRYHDIWATSDSNLATRRNPLLMAAPKMKLPGHAESYNAPPEYLPTAEEIQKWKDTDVEDRKQNFLPQEFSNLRSVPAYRNFITERFDRCLDLYLCPRQRKSRLNVDPEDLIPKLPKPRDLQPFPTTEAVVYNGHSSIVRSVSFEPSGQWFASGGEDCTVRLWETATGRCVRCLKLDKPVVSVAWCPNPAVNLVLVASGKDVLVLNPGLVSKSTCSATDAQIRSFDASSTANDQLVTWQESTAEDSMDESVRLVLQHHKTIDQVTWHGKGDYFASLSKDQNNPSKSVFLHQLSKRRTQCTFGTVKGLPQCCLFHPTMPFFFLATQRSIRVYNLQKNELKKKLTPGAKWISSLAVHPQGDNVICGSYDLKLSWFDMDLSTEPYKTLRHHRQAIRQVAFHKRYPLFASASDDGSVIVCHGTVYSDLLKNPLIVPVKVLKGHGIVDGRSVFDCQFHPSQPWILSAGADNSIRLFS